MAKRKPELVVQDTLMFDMLMHACVAHGTLLEDGKAANVYRIEAHCVAFEVTASPVYNGNKKIVGFEVHNYSKEDC